MNDGLRQRIVGALVLLALGIIFLPVIFDRERIVPVDRESQIPPEPADQILSLPEPPIAPRERSEKIAHPIDGRFDIEEPPEDSASVAAKSGSSPNPVGSEAALSVASAESETDSNQNKLEIAPSWVLQVASFESNARALSVLKELEAMRYRGFVREVDTSSGKRTRLFVGPNVSKPKLQQAKTEIDKKFKVESIILRFRP